MTPLPHETAAALLRRQQSTTARMRAGLPALLLELESLDEPELVAPGPLPRPASASPDRRAVDHETRDHQAGDHPVGRGDPDTGADTGAS